MHINRLVCFESWKRRTPTARLKLSDSSKMSTKHFINDAEALVLDALESLTDTNPTLRFDKKNKGMY